MTLLERLRSIKPNQPGWWMVERDDGKTRPLYLTQCGGAGGWSSDWREGYRFSSRENAEQQVELWHSAYGHARSHSMMVEFVNPDGPEAADTIERLTRAIEATRPTDEVVERVARAIHIARYGERKPDPMDDTDWEYCERLARAAIAAMPTVPQGDAQSAQVNHD